MRFDVTVLGSNSAIPAHGRHPSAQVVFMHEQYFLIDCGEGTQMRLDHFRIKKTRINHIFISHLHGDHIFGLIGLLLSLGLDNRQKPLYIYSPPGLQEIIDIQLKNTESPLSYEIIWKITNPSVSEVLIDNKYHTISTIPLDHRIPTHGFLFQEKIKPRKIQKDVIERYNIPYEYVDAIRRGADFEAEDGRIIANERLTIPPPPPRSFAYCSDTRYKEDIIPIIEYVDLLYHETTYTHDLVDIAHKYHHTTARQAAILAYKANVGRLLIGHFSSRYGNLDPLLEEAKTVFPSTHLAIEGKTFYIG